MKKKLKKDTLIYSPLVIVILAILCGGIGIWVGKDMAGVLQNALMGACMGIVGIPIFFFLMQFSFPAKRYMGNLKEQIEDVLSPAEREESADYEGLCTAECIRWNGFHGTTSKSGKDCNECERIYGKNKGRRFKNPAGLDSLSYVFLLSKVRKREDKRVR